MLVRFNHSSNSSVHHSARARVVFTDKRSSFGICAPRHDQDRALPILCEDVKAYDALVWEANFCCLDLAILAGIRYFLAELGEHWLRFVLR